MFSSSQIQKALPRRQQRIQTVGSKIKTNRPSLGKYKGIRANSRHLPMVFKVFCAVALIGLAEVTDASQGENASQGTFGHSFRGTFDQTFPKDERENRNLRGRLADYKRELRHREVHGVSQHFPNITLSSLKRKIDRLNTTLGFYDEVARKESATDTERREKMLRQKLAELTDELKLNNPRSSRKKQQIRQEIQDVKRELGLAVYPAPSKPSKSRGQNSHQTRSSGHRSPRSVKHVSSRSQPSRAYAKRPQGRNTLGQRGARSAVSSVQAARGRPASPGRRHDNRKELELLSRKRQQLHRRNKDAVEAQRVGATQRKMWEARQAHSNSKRSSQSRSDASDTSDLSAIWDRANKRVRRICTKNKTGRYDYAASVANTIQSDSEIMNGNNVQQRGTNNAYSHKSESLQSFETLPDSVFKSSR